MHCHTTLPKKKAEILNASSPPHVRRADNRKPRLIERIVVHNFPFSLFLRGSISSLIRRPHHRTPTPTRNAHARTTLTSTPQKNGSRETYSKQPIVRGPVHISHPRLLQQNSKIPCSSLQYISPAHIHALTGTTTRASDDSMQPVCQAAHSQHVGQSLARARTRYWYKIIIFLPVYMNRNITSLSVSAAPRFRLSVKTSLLYHHCHNASYAASRRQYLRKLSTSTF